MRFCLRTTWGQYLTSVPNPVGKLWSSVVWGRRLRVWDLGFRVWGSGFRSLGFRV